MVTADRRGPQLHQPPAYADFGAIDGQSGERLLRIKQRPPKDVVPTHLPAWNSACRDEGAGAGIAPGWLVAIGMLTGAGKSNFLLNMAKGAMESGRTFGLLSFEMSYEQLATRALAILSNTPVRELERGRHLSADAHRRAAQMFDEIRERTGGLFYTNRRPLRGDLTEVGYAMRHLVEEYGCQEIGVDYLQLIADPTDSSDVVRTSHALRHQAVDLNVAVVTLSQFNRATSASKEPPTIFGLFGGDVLAHDAHQILLLDHTTTQRRIDGWTADLCIAKNRHGPQARIPLAFDARTLRMRELLDDEIPARAA